MSLLPYDDRDGEIWLDGRFVAWREAKIHFLTHGLHYGSGVFEGMRSYNGRVFKAREHAQRLIDGCRAMDMDFPCTVEEVVDACVKTLAANGITDGYLRPHAWRGPEQMGISARQTKTHFGVAAWQWPSYFPAEVLEKGINLVTAAWRRPPPDCAPTSVKASGLYMICTLSKHTAERQGYHDALMLDYRGQVAELTGANFFMVINGELHTPKPDCFLNGITRLTVIDLARKAGIAVHERAIFPDELKNAQECFATGTAAEVTAIGSIDGHNYTVGPVIRRLRDDYSALVRSQLD